MPTEDQRGQVAVFVIGMALVLLAISGVAIDGTRAFLYRRTLQNAADAAARTAAARIDSGRYYSGETIALDPAEARSAALESLRTRGLRARMAIGSETRAVRIVLWDEIPTTFLGLVGIESLPVGVEAVAEPLPIP